MCESIRDYSAFKIYEATIGSQAYGLATEESDTDLRGVYIARTDWHWSIFGTPNQVDGPGTDEVTYELQTFLGHAMKCNPNIMEMLYSPIYRTGNDIGRRLHAERWHVLSKRAYMAYKGYAHAQFLKVQKKENLRVRNKHSMHLIRLMLAGISLFKEGEVLVDVSDYREELLGIKFGGDAGMEKALLWYKDLSEEFEETYLTTSVPDKPDYQWANNFLINSRKALAEEYFSGIRPEGRYLR